MTRGFVTIATGKEEYYKIALNLLLSYRCSTKNQLPFAIICDKENEYTQQFDQVVIADNPLKSYMDKFLVFNYTPFDESIFIESDCLAYGDLNVLFDKFNDADDFSCFGYTMPLDSLSGWFLLEETAEYKEKVHFTVLHHSGVMFIRKGNALENFYKTCEELIANFDQINIGGSSDALDDKIIGLSMAINNMRPTEEEFGILCVYPCFIDAGGKCSANMRHRHFTMKKENQICNNVLLVHWSNWLTKKALYKREVVALDLNSVKANIQYLLYTYVIPFSNALIAIRKVYNRILENEKIMLKAREIKRVLIKR